ncbi:MAG: PAS domain S-box protein [Kiritimatiellae bacterium]|nr:PAS domain S-box protein [Kiritimatiellia bacterium]MDD5521857.1 PAS domain S-box protein [Kiritimatiellia bacterium]
MSNKTNEILTSLAAEIIDKSSDGFLVISDKNQAIYANPALKRMHGFDPEETVTQEKTSEVLFPDPEERRKNIEEWKHDVALDNPPSREFPMMTKNGEKRWYRFQLSRISNGFLLVHVHDITDRKLLELQYRAIFEKAPDAIILADAKSSKIIEFNEKAFKMLGYTREEYSQLSIADIEASETKRQVRDHISDILKHGYDSFETSLCCKNGEIRYVYASTTAIEIADKKMLQAIMHDITDRKKAETALVESEEMFRNLADQSPNMIFINQDRRIVYVNHLCETMMGYSRKEYYSPDFNFMCLIAPEFHLIIEKAWIKHMKGEEAPSYEYEIVTKKGERIPAFIATKLIKYRGKPAILGIVTDISELKKVENNLNRNSVVLREQKKALQQKNTALKEILAQIEIEKIQIKKQVSINAEKLLLPTLRNLRTRSNSVDRKYIDLLETNIKQLVSKFGIELTNKSTSLSPKETEVCNMIKNGLSSKEIADMLHISLRTVDTHRNRIRKKFHLTTRNVNLSSHLQNLA